MTNPSEREQFNRLMFNFINEPMPCMKCHNKTFAGPQAGCKVDRICPNCGLPVWRPALPKR